MINSSAAVLAANELIEQYGRISADELAQALEINVWPRNFVKQKGVYTVILGSKYIFIKSDLSDEMRSIVLFHEIGHDRLHQKVLEEKGIFVENELFDCKNDIMENEANLFAAEMLLADSDIIELIYEGYTAAQVASALNADQNLVSLKIAELNRRGFKFREQEYKNRFLKAQ